jgi:hypothetical protein
MPDNVFPAQVPAGCSIRRAVNDPKLLGPVQGAELLDLAVGLDPPSFSGKLKIQIKSQTPPLLGKFYTVNPDSWTESELNYLKLKRIYFGT